MAKQQITTQVNGHTTNKPARKAPTKNADIFSASSVAEIKATLTQLHEQETNVTARLDALVSSQKDFSRELGRLDLLRANLSTQTSTTRNVSHGMLSDAAGTAGRISNAVRRLDVEQARVKATLEVVDQVAELKTCVLGVAGSMGAPQDWETAASYVNRAWKLPREVVHGAFAGEIVPTAEVPDSPSVTLENAAESLCGLFLREFEKAVKENNGAKITRFFKLFPLIGRSEVGLDVYGRYVCQGVAARARGNLNAGTAGSQSKDGFFYANALSRLFEHIAQIVEGHGPLVERHYGPGKMGRVIERLQVEADVQGGILLDTWSDERRVDRKLMDIKSYAFTFLVQSFFPPQRSGTPRSNSPAIRDAVGSEDEGVDMKEVDGLLNEVGVMLGRWSLYSRFMADRYNKKDGEQGQKMPKFLVESSLAKKITERLITPFNSMTTFFLRRSVEKAFQLDESPSGLTLNPYKPVQADPPIITSAVDDIMYIVNRVLQQSLATSQIQVVNNVLPTLFRILGADFVGMIQRKMRDEYYPKPVVQGGQPAEGTVITFLVLINNLDVAVDYMRRIVQNSMQGKRSARGSDDEDALQMLFPDSTEAETARHTMRSLTRSFETKTTELLSDGIQVIFNNVVKHRLRPILAESFRDVEYQPESSSEATVLNHDDDMDQDNDNDDDNIETKTAEIVRTRFTTSWNNLMKPLSRILTTSAVDRLLSVSVGYLARLLEKRLWSYQGRINVLGATRLERDVSGIVNGAVEGRYKHREGFSRCLGMVMVMGMEDDEWEEVMEGGGDSEEMFGLKREELGRVRGMVRR